MEGSRSDRPGSTPAPALDTSAAPKDSGTRSSAKAAYHGTAGVRVHAKFQTKPVSSSSLSSLGPAKVRTGGDLPSDATACRGKIAGAKTGPPHETKTTAADVARKASAAGSVQKSGAVKMSRTASASAVSARKSVRTSTVNPTAGKGHFLRKTPLFGDIKNTTKDVSASKSSPVSAKAFPEFKPASPSSEKKSYAKLVSGSDVYVFGKVTSPLTGRLRSTTRDVHGHLAEHSLNLHKASSGMSNKTGRKGNLNHCERKNTLGEGTALEGTVNAGLKPEHVAVLERNEETSEELSGLHTRKGSNSFAPQASGHSGLQRGTDSGPSGHRMSKEPARSGVHTGKGSGLSGTLTSKDSGRPGPHASKICGPSSLRTSKDSGHGKGLLAYSSACSFRDLTVIQGQTEPTVTADCGELKVSKELTMAEEYTELTMARKSSERKLDREHTVTAITKEQCEPEATKQQKEAIATKEPNEASVAKECSGIQVTRQHNDPKTTNEHNELIVTKEQSDKAVAKALTMVKTSGEMTLSQDHRQPTVARGHNESTMTIDRSKQSVTTIYSKPTVTADHNKPVVTTDHSKPAVTIGHGKPTITENHSPSVNPSCTEEFPRAQLYRSLEAEGVKENIDSSLSDSSFKRQTDSEYNPYTCSSTSSNLDRISPKSLTHLREYWTPSPNGAILSPFRTSSCASVDTEDGRDVERGEASKEGREGTAKESEDKEEEVGGVVFFRDRRPSAAYFTPAKAEGFPWLTWNFLIHVSETSACRTGPICPIPGVWSV